MPSVASTLGTGLQNTLSSTQFEKMLEQALEPFKQAITVCEHKIRNLEKRKGKLDSYKQEQEQGKELNNDQLTAVAKYNEVAQQLDMAREMMKQLTQIQSETFRSLKKQQKKDQAERAVCELEKLKQYLFIHCILRKMADPNVLEDFHLGLECGFSVTAEEIAAVSVLSKITNLEMSSPDFQNELQTSAEQLQNLCDEKSAAITGEVTFRDAKKLLQNAYSTGYFNIVPVPEEPPVVVEPVIVEAPVQPAPSVIEILAAQSVSSHESNYQFIQESQVDIESPHMDPAVVAVSSYAPPLLPIRSETNLAGYIPSSTTMIASGHSQSAMGASAQIDEMNLNHLSIKDSEEINEWDSTQSVQIDTSVNRESRENGEQSEEPQDNFDRTDRSGYRRSGGRPRAAPAAAAGIPINGFRGPRVVPSRGGFQNGRGFQGGHRENRYFPNNERTDRFERDDFTTARDRMYNERDERFAPERFGRSGAEQYDRVAVERSFERFEGGDNDMGEFRAPASRTGPGGPPPGGFGNRGGNSFGGRGMMRPGLPRGGSRSFRGAAGGMPPYGQDSNSY